MSIKSRYVFIPNRGSIPYLYLIFFNSQSYAHPGICQMSGKGIRIAVLTSGGDAQGMNAAIRSVVRLALFHHADVFYVKDGYKGLIHGHLEKATWESVANVIQTGGTFIGSARSKEFMTVEGRAKAATTLAKHAISAIICIGGDGSLTGLQLLQSEWRSHMDSLVSSGVLTKGQGELAAHLSVVGIVGSIDNDFSSSDITIGTDSALSRIVEAIDSVVDTAQSHQRTFVIEVMGRQCGYLALTAALATEADFVFVPEWPPGEDWREVMCTRLAMMRKLGRRLNVVIVAEGAADEKGVKITPEEVQKVVEHRLKYDTRVTKLGHVQRGGRASFLDRLLGTRMGAEAVATVLDPQLNRIACVIGIEGNKLKRVPLDKAIERNKMVATAFAKGDLNAVVRLRGKTFAEKVQYLQRTTEMAATRAISQTTISESVQGDNKGEDRPALAVMHVGAPAAGMNAVTHSFVRCALAAGYDVYGVHDSLSGLAAGNFEQLDWATVAGWVSRGGSMLGTKKERVTEAEAVASALARFKIKGLLIIGGFEAFTASLFLAASRKSLPALRIPITVVPATISNNVPGTRVSIGSDTALNEICRLIDCVKQSAIGTRGRAFIVETQGGKSGYLAAMGGLAGAADAIHTFEENVQMRHVEKQREEAERRVLRRGTHNYLVVRGEGCQLSSNEVLKTFGKSVKMTARLTVFGHIQQGGSPSVFDRQMGLRMGGKAVATLTSLLQSNAHPSTEAEGVVLIGLQGSSLKASPCHELAKVACFAHRAQLDTEWWKRLTQLARILASDEPAGDSDEKENKLPNMSEAVCEDTITREAAGGEETEGLATRLDGCSFESSIIHPHQECSAACSVSYEESLVEYGEDDGEEE